HVDEGVAGEPPRVAERAEDLQPQVAGPGRPGVVEESEHVPGGRDGVDRLDHVEGVVGTPAGPQDDERPAHRAPRAWAKAAAPCRASMTYAWSTAVIPSKRGSRITSSLAASERGNGSAASPA